VPGPPAGARELTGAGERGRRGRRARIALLALPLALSPGCAPEPAVERYRLGGSGAHWDVAGDDAVVEDLLPRYPDYFDVVLDPGAGHEPDLRRLRADLEHTPADRRNYDALNALAIGYFELNYRAQSDRGGERYLSDSFRAAQLLAVPWRAYGEVSDPALRDAILDFFADAGSGEKLETAGTAGRLVDVVSSLAAKEGDPARRARIRALALRIRAAHPGGPGEDGADRAAPDARAGAVSP